MALSKTLKLVIGIIVLVVLIAVICGLVYAFKTSNTPSLKFVPLGTESSNLIHYTRGTTDSVKDYTDKIDEFLAPYKLGHVNIADCSFEHNPLKDFFCYFDIRQLHPCTADNKYGYIRSSPCVFLTLNKINNWNPIFYNDSTKLPKEMPDYLKTHIQQLPDKKHANSIWVSCDGENSVDKENIGPVTYSSNHGFPGYYFPYTNVDGYESPIVAVQFERPRTGVVINIECKVWAQNINNNSTERSGSARFSLLID